MKVGRELARERAAAYKKSLRAKLRTLRHELKDARGRRRVVIKEAREQCRADRLALRDRLKDERRKLLEELKTNAKEARRAARETCALAKSEAHSKAHNAASAAAAKLAAERAYQADLKRIEQGNRAQRAAHLAKAKERRSESDDEVRSNIKPELVPLFDRVRRGIKASPRKSRTEAFLEYVEANPHEYLAAIEDGTERMIRELEEREAKTARLARKKRYTAAELAEVPF